VQADLFKISRGEKRWIVIIIVFIALLWCLPIYSVITNSLKFAGFSNYTYVLSHPVQNVPFPSFFVNSFICAIGSSSLCVFISAMSGFAFSKIRFTGHKFLFNIVLMCLAVSGPIMLVPFYYILKAIGLYNTYLAVILPEVVMTLPFGVLMMRNFFDGLPNEMMESANLDGANMWKVFSRVYLPLAKPALINLCVLQIMWSFQDFLLPLMFLTSPKLYTATVAVNAFKGVYGVTAANLGRYNAALVLIGLPSVLVFVFAQKYIVNGITTGAIKD